MKSKYFVDLENYRLSDYRELIKRSELLPGRRILHDKLKERFHKLSEAGIDNLELLHQNLKTSNKLKQLSTTTKIPIEYLTILKRELNRLLPKPVSLMDFPFIDDTYLKKLDKNGVKTTVQFFEIADTKKKRAEYTQKQNIPISFLNELIRLADISRIWGVGPIFCRIFLETGIDTVEKVASADPQELYIKLISINEVKEYTKAKFVVKDVELCVKIAQDLPKSIEI